MTRRIWDFKAGFHDVLFRLPVLRGIKSSEISNIQSIFQNVECGERVLEIGCGTGAYLDLYGSKSSVYGIDISIKMLKHAKDKINGSFLCASATHMPFRERSFHLVSAIGLLEYFEDKERVIGGVLRVLEPKGYFIVTYTNKNPLNFLRRLWGIRFHTASDDEMKALFESSGFDVVDVRRSLIQTQMLLRRR